MKHTPGPWTVAIGEVVGFNDNGEWFFISPETARVGDCGPAICVISHKHDANSTDAANARLIAAAPDMLEALITDYLVFEGYVKMHEENGKLEKAMANKAQSDRIAGIIESATGQKIDDILQATGQGE